MSATLCWTPAEPKGGGTFDDSLKFILRKKLFDPSSTSDVTIDEDFIDYLEGLKDGGIKDADTLIKEIEKHGNIRLWLEY